ncbi:motility associated factor glycosyltransferase family protein [Paenibacillus sp. Marseille-Q9583]
MKTKFENFPAIVVAAGQSLNNNIKQLKKINSKAVIIAVDTIAQRLCDEGIIPDFVCSIERGEVVYSYFYENKGFPSDIPIVAPLLLYPKIFEEREGDIIIPMRQDVGEYMWLQQILGLSDDNSISIGISCAHVAFGFAAHVGASPIVLVGQDLAFGNSVNETHAGGTIYDKTKSANEEAYSKESLYTEGYYGADIATTDLWNSFRTWFEIEISEKRLNVINATEGGAKIENTIQMDLENVITEYCSEGILPIKELMKKTAPYPLEKSEIIRVLGEQQSSLEDMKAQFEEQLKIIKRISLTSRSSEKALMKALSKLEKTDQLFNLITENSLLKHNLQPVMLSCVWDLFTIEQILSATNLMTNRAVQLEFLTVCIFVLAEIINILQETLITF